MNEYQSTESRLGTIEASYTFVGTREQTARSRARRSEHAPAGFFRYRVIKRCLDVGLVVLTLPISIVVIAMASVLVMLGSRGPIFYSHRRIRKDGTFFSMWKFRTMCVNSAEVLEQYLEEHPEAREESRRTHKLRYDPRVTAIGSFLRRYSMDELPQLWNVLKGEMTLVGPRPIVAAEVERYGDFFSYYCRVKPGLTGLWQVSGRSRVSYDARVTFDCTYVQQWSLWGDLVILMRTLPAVANQDGSY
jgi:lipopolysaccharide/colanic/teichoic acid biosynthesis glycosyltransferase